jgi:hypothetical protein
MTKAATPAEIKLMDRLEQLRYTLLSDTYADRVDRRLAFWATASDRRLPPFDELSRTPGVGPKKMSSLIMLLERAIVQQPMDGEITESLPAPEESKVVVEGPKRHWPPTWTCPFPIFAN